MIDPLESLSIFTASCYWLATRTIGRGLCQRWRHLPVSVLLFTIKLTNERAGKLTVIVKSIQFGVVKLASI